MPEDFLSIEKLTVSLAGQKILEEINFRWKEGEQWALVGPTGSGKTTLAHALAGKQHFNGRISTAFGNSDNWHDSITMVDQQHRFRDLGNQNNFYYQQRYNSTDATQTVTIEEDLDLGERSEKGPYYGHSLREWLNMLRLDHLLKEPLIQLSNGENKRLQILKALLKPAKLLILDQPFTGLDVDGRMVLSSVLGRLAEKKLHLLLIITAAEIPDFVTHVAFLEKGRIKETFLKKPFPALNWVETQKIDFGRLPVPAPDKIDFQFAVRMINVRLSYGGREILKNINWNVARGERWSLSGPNGAGKSALLSLITADNPQSYANEIYLFDRKRGTGESIWEIKKQIGFVSPELQLYFDPAATCFETIASGLFDTIGLFRRLLPADEAAVLAWAALFSLKGKENNLFSRLSPGEQRLALLARALIKQPPMLVLDEPCQGLDQEQALFFKTFIDRYCEQSGITMIYVSHYNQEIPSCVSHWGRIENGFFVIGEKGI